MRRSIDPAELREHLGDVMEAVRTSHVPCIVQPDGGDPVAIVPLAILEEHERQEARWERELRRVRAHVATRDPAPIMEAVDEVIREVRLARRARRDAPPQGGA